MNPLRILFAVVLATFLISPALFGRLDPNGYEGGRSRDVQQRALRNSSAVATMLGEFRTAMSDIMYMKTERYLDNGIAFMPHLKKEILSASGSAMLLPTLILDGKCWMPASITTMPAVRAQMASASRMGTPDCSSVPSVRVKRATAILRSTGPMMGSLSIVEWTVRFPPGAL